MTEQIPVAIVATAQTPSYRRLRGLRADAHHGVRQPTCSTETGLERHDIDFTIAGSCDYLSGMPFAFVSNIDGVGAWPPVYESHVEMDGAWALFEAWLRLQVGDIDMALVIGSGKSSPGRPLEVFSLQTDPYVMAPLGLDPLSLAGLQARALIDAGIATEADFAEVVSRSRRDALDNPNAQVSGDHSRRGAAGRAVPVGAAPPPRPAARSPTARPRWSSPRGDRARELTDHPVWIRGIDHRIDSHHPGLRDLTTVAVDRAGRRGRRGGRRTGRRGRAHGQLQPGGDRAAEGARI